MICFVLWIAVIGEKASKYRDDRRYRDLTQATVRSCLIMSSQQDGTWAAVPTNLYHMTTPDPVEPLLLDLVGHIGLYTAQEAARQVMQLLKQVIVDIAPIKDVEPARLHQTP